MNALTFSHLRLCRDAPVDISTELLSLNEPPKLIKSEICLLVFWFLVFWFFGFGCLFFGFWFFPALYIFWVQSSPYLCVCVFFFPDTFYLLLLHTEL